MKSPVNLCDLGSISLFDLDALFSDFSKFTIFSPLLTTLENKVPPLGFSLKPYSPVKLKDSIKLPSLALNLALLGFILRFIVAPISNSFKEFDSLLVLEVFKVNISFPTIIKSTP